MTEWIVRGGVLSNPDINEGVVIKGAATDGPGTGVVLALGPSDLLSSWNLHIEHPARVEVDFEKGLLKLFDAEERTLLVLLDNRKLAARKEERRRKELADAPRQRKLALEKREEKRIADEKRRYELEVAERPQRRAEFLERVNAEHLGKGIKFISEGEGDEAELFIELADGTRLSPGDIDNEWLRINGFRFEVY